MFEQLESLVLESFVIRTPNGKREKSLAQHKARLDAKREKVADKYRSKASKWIVNEHGTPVTVNGVRQFAPDCSPTRRAALEALAAAYDKLEDSEVSPFGEYVEKEGFFESDNEIVELSPPVVEINEGQFYANAIKFLKLIEN